MRVVHVGNYKPDSPNGVDKTIVGLVRHLPAHGVNVEVWHPTDRAKKVRERIEDCVFVYDLPVKRIAKGLCIFSPEAKRFISSKVTLVDVFHFHSVFLRENLQLAKFGGPYVITPNGGYDKLVLKGRNRIVKAIWFRLWERPYIQKAGLIHAVSIQEQKAIAKFRLDVPVRYIPNGIDDGALNRTAEVPSHQSDLLYLGRLAVDQKGLDLLLEGYASARANVPDLPRLMLAGPDFRGGLGQLTKIARVLGIADRVVFLGPVFGEQKWHVLSQARLFVHTSRWEGMPFALLEAMATGRPALVTRGTNFADAITAADAGWVAETNPQSIATTLLHAINETPAQLDEKGHRARELIRTEYSWSSVASSLAKCYSDVLGDARRQ